MAKEGTLLIVDDNRSILAALRLLLEKYFARVLTLPTPNRLATTLREEQIDVILLDMNFTAGINTGNEGIYWLSEIHARRPDIKVVLFTAYADIDLAVRAMRDGAVDFVVKPWDNDRLVASLRNAYNLARSAREVKQLKEIKRELASEQPMFWGESPAMARIREIVEKVAATDANILITGENGTGKEMLAREIHNRSARSGELMVSVDMGAVPETLFESELFGHVRGAFTDARADRDLFGMVARGGEFREDLLYRINTIHIDLPPLRQRREDILPLAEMFLKRYATKYNKPIEGFDQAAVREMDEYPWAGNIRELQHTVEKAVIMSDGRRITPATLLLRPAPAAVQALAFSTLEEMERGMIGQAMARYAGNLTEVARQLGITRQTLYNKIKRYGL